MHPWFQKVLVALCQAMTRIWSQLWSKGESESVTNCHRLKLLAEDGKMRLTDVASPETLPPLYPILEQKTGRNVVTG